MAEKLNTKEQAVLRKEIYNLALERIAEEYAVETVSDGALIFMPEGQMVLLKAIYKDPTKFSLEEAREEYIEKCKREKERLEKAAEVAKKRAEKEAEKLAKAESASKK